MKEGKNLSSGEGIKGINITNSDGTVIHRIRKIYDVVDRDGESVEKGSGCEIIFDVGGRIVRQKIPR